MLLKSDLPDISQSVVGGGSESIDFVLTYKSKTSGDTLEGKTLVFSISSIDSETPLVRAVTDMGIVYSSDFKQASVNIPFTDVGNSLPDGQYWCIVYLELSATSRRAVTQRSILTVVPAPAAEAL